MRRKLTKRAVDAIEPDDDRDQLVWDTEIKGFGVKVTPAGARVYVSCSPFHFVYTLKHGIRRAAVSGG